MAANSAIERPLRGLIDQGRVACLCGRRATGTTLGGEPECDDLACHAAEEVERLRGALQEIATADPVDMALDPDWAARIARAALGG